MPGFTMPGTRLRLCSIEQGVHIRVVQEILGHTRVTTTERYTHVATLQMKDASELMDRALWGQRAKAIATQTATLWLFDRQVVSPEQPGEDL
jgi:hypothetical protein